MKSHAFIFLIPLLFSHFTCEAALHPLSPENLQVGAEVIVTGRVVGTRLMTHRKPGSSVYFVRLKVEVTNIEKGGNLLGDSRYLDIRCWQIRRSENIEPAGHSLIPADGSSFRVWLRKNQDDNWEPLEPNGIELLDGSPAMEFAAAERKDSVLSIAIGGFLGIATLVIFVIFHMRRRRIS